nr:hypothetical protein [Saccharopolyspora sp. HNM0983]
MIPAALGIGAVAVLGGCSAGQVTETDTQVAAVNGASGDAQDVAVRNAHLSFPTAGASYPAGSSAPLELVIANEGPDDQLVRVTSPYAQSADLGGETALPQGTALHGTGESAGAGPTDGAQPGEPQTGEPQTPAPASPNGQREVQITLTGFTQEIGPGVVIPVTFEFANAGPVTMQVPIGEDDAPRPEHNSPVGGAGH